MTTLSGELPNHDQKPTLLEMLRKAFTAKLDDALYYYRSDNPSELIQVADTIRQTGEALFGTSSPESARAVAAFTFSILGAEYPRSMYETLASPATESNDNATVVPKDDEEQ